MKATMRTFFEDPNEFLQCEIVLPGDEIRISYPDDDQPGKVVVWTGKQVADGHYSLACPQKHGRGILHRTPEEPDVLRGCWFENKEEGMWRIELAE